MDFEAIKTQFDLTAEVERDLGYPLKTSGKWRFWRCPFHADSDPSFGVADDRFHCFGCEKSGDVVDWLRDFRGLNLDDIFKQAHLDTVEVRLRRLEYRQREHARQLADQERRLNALERIHACRDHLYYHESMPDEGWQYWYEAGLWPETIRHYKLGYCHHCPTDTEGRPSYTIPVFSNGLLWNIRHRLAEAPDGDKYRPHIPSLPNVLFNADYLRGRSEDILIVEGEKKSIVAAQEGFPNVGVMGKSGFSKAWARLFANFRRVYVCYDPDGLDKAVQVAQLFEGRGRVVLLPGKLDDLIVQYHANAADIRYFVELGKKV